MSAISGDDALEVRLRGFGPVGILAILVVLAGNFLFAPLSAVLALIWARASNTPWREIGLVRPRSWLQTILVGLVIGVALKLMMKAVVMPLFGAPPINPTFAFLTGNPAALPRMLFAVTVGAGFGEETLFRGYLFERLGRVLGSGRIARAAILAITTALFGVAHYPEQGLPGVQQALVVGLAYGGMYAATRGLALPMIAHAAFDLAAVAMIYFGLETAVARSIFG